MERLTETISPLGRPAKPAANVKVKRLQLPPIEISNEILEEAAPPQTCLNQGLQTGSSITGMVERAQRLGAIQNGGVGLTPGIKADQVDKVDKVVSITGMVEIAERLPSPRDKKQDIAEREEKTTADVSKSPMSPRDVQFMSAFDGLDAMKTGSVSRRYTLHVDNP